MTKAGPQRSRPLLRRYTNLAATIHLLQTRRITLLDPKTWDDKNDAHFLAQYSKCRGGNPVLALCFCQGPTRYHHWRVYANGMDGVCIQFHRDHLLAELDDYEDLLHDDVRYQGSQETLNNQPRIDDLPFLKRSAYKDECEYRIIRVCMGKFPDTLEYTIDLGCIQSVVLSPWMPKELSTSVISALRTIEGCKGLRVSRSRLIESEVWKQFGSSARRREDEMISSRPKWIPVDDT